MARSPVALLVSFLFLTTILSAQKPFMPGSDGDSLFRDRTERQPETGSYSPTPQALSVVIEPYNPPIIIPQGGGSFTYIVTVTNGEEFPEVFDLWTVAMLPNGNPYGPVLGPLEFLLPGGWSAARSDLSQYVPAFAPAGIYTYRANVGTFPNQILGTDSFTLEKLGVGAGWYEQSPGTSENLLALDFVDTEIGWAVGYNTIVHTIDGGDTWFPQDDGQIYPHEWFDIFFLDSENGWIVGDGFSLGGTILMTTDGGENWMEQLPDSDRDLFGISFADAGNGWAVGGDPETFPGDPTRMIQHTTDGGATWNQQYLEFDAFPFNAVYAADANNVWAVGGTGDVFHTTNGGDTWSEQSSGVAFDLNSVYFVDANTGWAVGDLGTVIHTTNGGTNWSFQGVGLDNYYLEGVHFFDDMTGWACGFHYITDFTSAILHTTDGGNTWEPQDPGTGNAEILLRDIDFVDASQGWSSGGVYQPEEGVVVHTETGGD